MFRLGVSSKLKRVIKGMNRKSIGVVRLNGGSQNLIWRAVLGRAIVYAHYYL